MKNWPIYLGIVFMGLCLVVGCEKINRGAAATTQALGSSGGQVVATAVAAAANTFLPGSGILLTALLTALGAAAGAVVDYDAFKRSQTPNEKPYDWKLAAVRILKGAMVGAAGGIGVVATQ